MEGMSHDGSMTAMADTPAREHMACFYTASAALVTGSLTSLAGIGFMLSVRASMRRMTAVLLGVLGGLVILTPLYIYPTCESPEMFCNQGARQLLIVLGVTLLLAAGWFGLRPGGDRQYAVAS